MNLFVGNLHPDTMSDNLRRLFSEFGNVVSCKVIFDNATGVSKGFGFVEMEDKHSAFDAINNLDQTFFEGNIISVKEAKQNTKPGGGSGGGYGNSGGNNKRPFKPRSPRDDSRGSYGNTGRSYQPRNYGNSQGNSYNSDRFNKKEE